MPFLLFPFGLDKFYHILVKFHQINQLVLQKFSFEYEKIYLSCKETLVRTQVNKVKDLLIRNIDFILSDSFGYFATTYVFVS